MIRLKKAIFYNRAPFDKLELNFDDANIAVLLGINGKGKTTILSHIVDAFYEIAKKGFSNEFKGKEYDFYRLSGSIWSLNGEEPSIVYFQFTSDKDVDEEVFEYLDIKVDKKEYFTLDNWKKIFENLENIVIKFEDVEKILNDNSVLKIFKFIEKKIEPAKEVRITKDVEPTKAKKIFDENILTYFPSYRYEQPAYLNAPYKVNLQFTKESSYIGYLTNPLEVVTDLPNIANWFMDVVLDTKVYEEGDKRGDSARNLLEFMNEIISVSLASKIQNRVRLGFGTRINSGERIAITLSDGKIKYPSIFNISSGEAAVLCIFGELLKQADKIGRLTDVSGIVLIDEVDKHLHFKLQREVLPKLFIMFPNIQFIVTSHSPFFTMGLADLKESDKPEGKKYKSKIFDLDLGGTECEPEQNEQYNVTYEMMLGEKNNYDKELKNLKSKIGQLTKPLIITEGKTDIKHLQNAQKMLGIQNIDVEYYPIEDIDKWNNSKLKCYLENLSKTKQTHRIIGIFDRDDNNYFLEYEGKNFKIYTHKEGKEDVGSNVFAFNIPELDGDPYKNQGRISIEHYYQESELKEIKDNEGRRLFLAGEFHKDGYCKNEEADYYTRASSYQNKIEINAIIDEKVYRRDDHDMKKSIALSKNDFAELVKEKNLNYENFKKIFDVIKEIVDYQESQPNAQEGIQNT